MTYRSLGAGPGHSGSAQTKAAVRTRPSITYCLQDTEGNFVRTLYSRDPNRYGIGGGRGARVCFKSNTSLTVPRVPVPRAARATCVPTIRDLYGASVCYTPMVVAKVKTPLPAIPASCDEAELLAKIANINPTAAGRLAANSYAYGKEGYVCKILKITERLIETLEECGGTSAGLDAVADFSEHLAANGFKDTVPETSINVTASILSTVQKLDVSDELRKNIFDWLYAAVPKFIGIEGGQGSQQFVLGIESALIQCYGVIPQVTTTDYFPEDSTPTTVTNDESTPTTIPVVTSPSPETTPTSVTLEDTPTVVFEDEEPSAGLDQKKIMIGGIIAAVAIGGIVVAVAMRKK